MKRMPSRRPSRRRGQAMVELALSLPLLLGVLVLIVEGTLMVSSSHTLMDAVHQATRVASREKLADAEIRHRIQSILSNDPLVRPGEVQVEVRYGLDTNGNDNVTILAKLPVRPVTFTSVGSFELAADATYRVARDEDGAGPS